MPRAKFEPRTCAKCRGEFEPKTGNAKYCSTCNSSQPRPTKVCELCSAPFVAVHGGHIWCNACVPKRSTHGNTPYRYYARHYGLSKQQFDAMMAAQENACAVCRRPFKEMSSRNVHVDHCHDTGLVRGILCVYCNRGIGCFFNNPEALNSAASYLKRHNEKKQERPESSA